MMGHTRRAFLGAGLAAAAGAAGPPPAQTPTGSFWEPLDRQMIGWLAVKPADRVLDAGCGRGDHLGVLAESAAAVCAMDLNARALGAAKERLKGHPRTTRLTFHEGDVLKPPFAAGAFDLVWASHVLHILKDPVAGARALKGVLKPGGRLAVREDLAMTHLLPLDIGVGRPGLEYRTQAIFMDWFIDDRLKRGRVPYGWAKVLTEAGLTRAQAKSFLFELSPPFTAAQERHLRGYLRRQLEWGNKLTKEDRQALEHITDAKSKHDALRRPDLHLVSVSTVYLATA